MTHERGSNDSDKAVAPLDAREPESASETASSENPALATRGEEWRSQSFWTVPGGPDSGGDTSARHGLRRRALYAIAVVYTSPSYIRTMLRSGLRASSARAPAGISFLDAFAAQQAIDLAQESGLAAQEAERHAMALFLRSACIEYARWQTQASRIIDRFRSNCVPVAVAAAAVAVYALLVNRWAVPWWATGLTVLAGLLASMIAFVSAPSGDGSYVVGDSPVVVRRYLRSAVLLTVGLASAALTLSIGYPGALLAILCATPAVALAVTSAELVLFGALRLSLLLRFGPDPYVLLALLLARALMQLRRAQAGGRLQVPLERRARFGVVNVLDNAVVALRAWGTRPAPGSGPSLETQAILSAQRDEVLGWLYEIERQMLWPDPEAPAEVAGCIAVALVGICHGDWSSLRGELPAVARRERLRRILPRAAVSAVLLAAALAVPAVLGSVLSDAAAATLRVSLIISALTALLAPTEALSAAAKTTAAAVGGTKA